jgi:PAS domain S-box-containing protein
MLTKNTADEGLGAGVLTDMQTSLEKLRVAEEEIRVQYDELQQNRSLEDQRLLRYQALFQSAPTAYLTTDEAGTITDANDAALRLFRRPADRLVGRPLGLLIDLRDRHEFRMAVNRIARQRGHEKWTVRTAEPLTGDAEITATVSAAPSESNNTELWWILHVAHTRQKRDALAEAVKEVTSLLAGAGDIDDLLITLCERGADIVDAAACGMLLADEDGNLQTLAASDQSAAALELFQMQHAEGPCYDAFRTNNVVIVTDIDGRTEEWPGFVQRARQQGLQSVISVPLRSGAAAIGALNVLNKRPNAFDDSDMLAAETLASLAAFGISFGRTLVRTQEAVHQLQHALDSRVIIEQAKGMLAERAGVEPSTAFHALRSFARNHNLSLHEVCRKFVDGQLPIEVLGLTSAASRHDANRAPDHR